MCWQTCNSQSINHLTLWYSELRRRSSSRRSLQYLYNQTLSNYLSLEKLIEAIGKRWRAVVTARPTTYSRAESRVDWRGVAAWLGPARPARHTLTVMISLPVRSLALSAFSLDSRVCVSQLGQPRDRAYHLVYVRPAAGL